MSENIFEIFDNITLSDEQKKLILDNILKNKNAPFKKKKAIPLYIRYIAGFAATLVICFSGKSFYDTHKKNSDVYVKENQSVTSSETGISGAENEKSLLRQEALDNSKAHSYVENKHEPIKNGEAITIAEEPKKEMHADTVTDDKTEEMTEEKAEEKTDEAAVEFSPIEEHQSEKKEEVSSGGGSFGGSSGGGSSAKKKVQSLSENEIYQNEKFGLYVPKQIMSGYTFSSAAINENMLSIYYNNDFYSVVVTINILTDGSSYDRIVVEREDDNGKYYDVPVDNGIISYFVSDKSCDSEAVKAMIYSAECFNKTIY